MNLTPSKLTKNIDMTSTCLVNKKSYTTILKSVLFENEKYKLSFETEANYEQFGATLLSPSYFQFGQIELDSSKNIVAIILVGDKNISGYISEHELCKDKFKFGYIINAENLNFEQDIVNVQFEMSNLYLSTWRLPVIALKF